MSSLWHSDGGEWAALEPAGFPDEASLHRMVADAPQLLPLSGQPEIVVLGSEVALGGGIADVVGVEVGGRPVIIEVKLARNSEARRAVVAQALAYAAVLHGLTVDELEQEVLRAALARSGHATIRSACEAADPALLPEQGEFIETLSGSLERGHVRIVFVLDRAPRELIRLVGYLEAITEGLVIDLITVAQYRVGDQMVVVPQRVDPERAPMEEPQPQRRLVRGTAGRARPTVTGGVEKFLGSLDVLAPEPRDATLRMVEWAQEVEADGAARLFSYQGTTDDITLLMWLPDEDAGIIAMAKTAAGPRFYIYGSVLDRRAPQMRETLQVVLVVEEIGRGNVVRDITPDRLAAVAQAYSAAMPTRADDGVAASA